jgi:U4/U6.U5 tri-snRNP-associated protein 2
LVSDPSLDDILYVLNPRHKASSLSALSTLPNPSHTLSSTPYLPGYIGLNNIKKSDYLNVILQLLLHVPPLRTFLLNPNSPELQEERRPTELVQRLSTLCKRFWNPRLFKAQISPHEFLQEVGKRSGGKFKMTEQGDPVEFLGWLVNTLHRDLGGSKKKGSSVIYSTFQGKVQIETQQVITHKDQARPVFDISRGEHCRMIQLTSRHSSCGFTIFIPRTRFTCHAFVHGHERKEDYPSSPTIYDHGQV